MPTASTTPTRINATKNAFRTPTREHGADDGEAGHCEARGKEPSAHLELHGSLFPRSQTVASVEVPVAEASHDLRSERGPRDGRERLCVLEDVYSVGTFYAKPCDPKQRDAEREDAHFHPGTEHAARRSIVQHEDRVEEPQHRGDAGVDQRGRIGRADERDHKREQGRVAPSAPAHGEHRERDEPAETRPGQEYGRGLLDVLQEVRAEGVGEPG